MVLVIIHDQDEGGVSRVIFCLQYVSLVFYGSLGVAVVGGICGGNFVVEPQNYPHIPALSRRFPKTLFYSVHLFICLMVFYHLVVHIQGMVYGFHQGIQVQRFDEIIRSSRVQGTDNNFLGRVARDHDNGYVRLNSL